MNTGTGLPDPAAAAAAGAPAKPPSLPTSPFQQFTAGHWALIGTGVNLLFSILLMVVVVRNLDSTSAAPDPGSAKAAATKRVDDVTLGEARELAEELGKVSDSLAPFLDARLKPLKDQLKTQGETLDKVAEKVLGP